MRLTRSNRTEDLVGALASQVKSAPLGPFDSEVIVVQSRGMERWLTLALAERLGIWSHPSFPFPRTAIERVLDDLDLGSSERSQAYDRARLKWSIAELLQDDAPADLHAYLGESGEPDRVLRLSANLASMFDEYIVYRPSLLRTWERGADTQWQANLWRRLNHRLGAHDLASRIEAAIPVLGQSSPREALRYKRLHLLSFETLPPMFLRFFEALSAVVPTHLYLLAPTSEYVSNVDRKGQLSLGIEPDRPDGHPLLTSLGGLARDFQELLLEADGAIENEEDRWNPPNRECLLGALQADILAFKGPPATREDAISPSDSSISVHACTSPMREVLVLHDLIREALEENPTLRPEDIVVMTPDLDAYAPAFRAVFGRGGGIPIPFEVHDRKARDDSAFYDDFLAALDVLESRFSVLDVVRLMDAQSWRDELCFSPGERARLTDLLEAAGVRWGIDAEHRDALGFPPEALHTWRSGLARLFLGFSTAPGTVEVFDDLLPRGELSLDDAGLVARLSRLCSVLFEFHGRMQESRSVPEWADLLGHFSEALFAEEDDATGAVRVLRGAFEGLRRDAEVSDYVRPLPLRTIKRELASAVVRDTPSAGFLRRGVTLSELVPLRSIPFRMVCLLGMSEESFPRADDRPSFDLIRSRHALGDRNRRNDDRHSFLQAVLCARERLAITYSAQATSARTKPTPSPVVWELMDTVGRYYRREGAESALSPVEHPLHAFDSLYFDETSAFSSFSTRYLSVAQEIRRPVIEAGHVELRAKPEPPSETLSIRGLSQWIWHPAREFIQRALRTRFDDTTLYEPTGALVELGNLDAFRVGNDALEQRLQGETLRAYFAAAPEFPDGSWGKADQARVADEVETLLARRSDLVGADEGATHLVTAKVRGITLEGRLEGLYDSQRVKQRFNRAETKTEVSTWLEHLLLQASDEAGLPTTTELVLRATGNRASTVCFGRVDNPHDLLRALVDVYLESQANPAALLNRASWAFAAAVHDGKGDRALELAKKRCLQDQQWDRYARFVWGKSGPFTDRVWTERFVSTTRDVYGPLFAHRSER